MKLLVLFKMYSISQGLSKADYFQYPVVSLSGELLMQAAFLYTLWGYHAGAAKAWHICCKFARKMHQDDLLLQGWLN